ncbi:MAG: hypothetical protein KKA07_15250 [Bacteroidetes bacterium]|nr:hypothetical protein [Bacteroidota bacterium]MBU1720418.1 hypothetical protein [Bacteroidota bacterium]
MILTDNSYQVITFDESKSMLTESWKPGTIDMNEDAYKKELTIYADWVEKYQPKRILVNIQNLMFAITPGIQIWTINNIVIRVVEAGPDKQAFIVPRGFPIKLAHEEKDPFDDDMDLGINIRYYDNPEEATKWILL